MCTLYNVQWLLFVWAECLMIAHWPQPAHQFPQWGWSRDMFTCNGQLLWNTGLGWGREGTGGGSTEIYMPCRFLSAHICPLWETWNAQQQFCARLLLLEWHSFQRWEKQQVTTLVSWSPRPAPPPGSVICSFIHSLSIYTAPTVCWVAFWVLETLSDPLRNYRPVARVWSQETIDVGETLNRRWFQVGKNHIGYEIWWNGRQGAGKGFTKEATA